ncbi:YncE family protein [Hyalangium versicolor]|uniref:YncE family protein n=1 Tax=Hyalangium versicolor TaxID=2861190 RepID=UPI001CCB671D|nr:hypothetical protein [Hyalangium versicolor]
MRTLLLLDAVFSLAACGGGSSPDTDPNPEPESLKPTFFVASEGTLVSFDVETGTQREGVVQDVSSPSDLQVLEDGTVMLHLTSRDEVLAVDGHTLKERARFSSSSMGGERPTHSYVSPTRDGKRYWLTLNDGRGGKADSSTALFVDVTPGSPTYLQRVGEVRLGVGHHMASFSSTRERVVISNIADCNDVVSVFDYSDVKNIQKVRTFSAGELGFACDLSTPVLPHGCATSKLSGRAYCNLTGPGVILSINVDAPSPSFNLLYTGGKGGGHTVAQRDGSFIYSLQETPREGSSNPAGASCQIGQLALVDAAADSLVGQLPLFYSGPACDSKLEGTDEARAQGSHLVLSRDGKTLFITPSAATDDVSSHVRKELVVDVSRPYVLVQRESIPVGLSTGIHGDALSPDGRSLFVANNVDSTVSEIDTASLTVKRTLTFPVNARTMSLFGTDTGPSEQVGPIP